MSNDFVRDLPGLTTPISHPGRVVYNARRDFLETNRRRNRRGVIQVYTGQYGDDDIPLSATAWSNENHSIQPYELCLKNKKTRHLHHTPNDTDITCFSSANGLVISAQEPVRNPAGGPGATIPAGRVQLRNVKDQLAAAGKNLDFAGIAGNRAAYDPNNTANEEGLAVQIGGLQTMYNTGDVTIKAGQIVLWDFPRLSVLGKPAVRIPGVRRDKLLFSTVPYTPGGGPAAQPRIWSPFSNSPPAIGQPIADADAGNFYAKYAEAMFDIQRRVIGKALSTAKPGHPFDLIIGHYCI